MHRINKALFHSVAVDFTYENEGMRLGPFEMLHVPGHCAGQVVIRLHDVLFCGDHVLDHISPHQWPERLTFFTGLGHYLDSLVRLVDWAKDVSLTLAGHNDQILDLAARVEEIRRLHSDRLRIVRDYLAGPHTIADVSRKLFGKVSGYDSLLAIEEAGAHVEYLYQRGLLRVVNVDELESKDCPVVIRYQQIDDPITKKVGLL
jgi:glyoxylase-like metal-dependent hydrolase (beta-lactamase superfamily II)